MKAAIAIAATAGVALGLALHGVAYRLAADEPAAVASPAARTIPTSTGTQPARSRSEPFAMSEHAFWQLIEQTRKAARNDTGRQTDLLKDRLTRLSPRAILDFARIRDRLDTRAYTRNLWAAAYVIEDGCLDDCFGDFRAYLISLGREPYEHALQDPDSLASVAQGAETGDWDKAGDPAPDAYSCVTGTDFPPDHSVLSGRPRGKPLDDYHMACLLRRFPRLAAKFR